MTTVQPDPGVIWFNGLGFRPAVWTSPHRADEVDPARLVPAPDADEAYASKYDLPATLTGKPDGYAWGTWIPGDAAGARQITAASLAGPVTASTVQPSPWWPLLPTEPEWPCCIVDRPTYPEPTHPAQVPVEAGAGAFLLVAVGALFARKIWDAAGAFGDWFCAERGTGPHQNGWV